MKRIKELTALAATPLLLIGAFFVASSGQSYAAPSPAATANTIKLAAAPASLKFHTEASATGTVASSDKVAPSTVAHTYTHTFPAPASVCAQIKQAHPNLRIGATCNYTQTFHVGAAQVVKSAGALQPATVTPASTYTVSDWSQLCAVTCALWHNKVSSAFYFTGGKVWVDYLDCNDSGGIGYTVSVTWCGTYHNGATSQTGSSMNDGDDFTVSAVAKGVPISASHWQRINCNVDGQTWVTSDGH